MKQKCVNGYFCPKCPKIDCKSCQQYINQTNEQCNNLFSKKNCKNQINQLNCLTSVQNYDFKGNCNDDNLNLKEDCKQLFSLRNCEDVVNEDNCEHMSKCPAPTVPPTPETTTNEPNSSDSKSNETQLLRIILLTVILVQTIIIALLHIFPDKYDQIPENQTPQQQVFLTEN